ncbi:MULTISPECIES: site-specific integrase [Polaromonas]|uniref:Site-specific integrase n=1 Tax=Polaromonas aquatica TaxID=332657 RepID=A0ABW1U0E0_9BURK
MDLIKVSQGSPLLSGKGVIPVVAAASELGMTADELLLEMWNTNTEVFFEAHGWEGKSIHIDEVEREYSADRSSFTYLIDDALEKGESIVASGMLYASKSRFAIESLRDSAVHNDWLFFADSQRKKAIFFDAPGQYVKLDDVLVQKGAIDAIRVRLAAKITPGMLEEHKASRISAPVMASKTILKGPLKYEEQPVSVLIAEFCETKKVNWGLPRQQKMAQSFSLFIEAMGDPVLGTIDRGMMKAYRDALKLQPHHPERVRNSHAVSTFKELQAVAKANSLPLMTTNTLNTHCEHMSELFTWAVREEMMERNPAEALVTAKRDKRDQDSRAPFSDADLQLIFGAEWFQNGKGTPTSKGKYFDFRPHYYWLPLLGLFTGARLNELCQLHLTDIKRSAAATDYFDFNLDDEDKTDEGSGREAEKDKSLKNVNSRRIVPVHQILIDLGFIEYVEALRKAGHKRLFPEISRDRVKGYSKDPGKWHNQRYLWERLHIPRDNKKTFHSYRHMFSTALHNLAVQDLLVNQLMGHERGTNENQNRYRHDMAADGLVGEVNKLNFALPTIAKFDVACGIAALDWALENKRTRKVKGKPAL